MMYKLTPIISSASLLMFAAGCQDMNQNDGADSEAVEKAEQAAEHAEDAADPAAVAAEDAAANTDAGNGF